MAAFTNQSIRFHKATESPGHADVSTTLNLYVHPDKELKSRAINAMLKSINRDKAEDDEFDISQIQK